MNVRKAQDLTQAQLGKLVGVTQQQIASFELGRRRIRVIAGILGTISDELLGLKATTITGSGIKNRRLYRRLQDIEKLRKRDQQALLRTVDAFVSKAG